MDLVRALLARAQAERAALAAHNLPALGLPAPSLLVEPLPTPDASGTGALVPVPLLDAAGGGAPGAGGGAPFRLASAGGTSVTTTYGGPGNPGFNIVGTSNVQTYYNCKTVLGVKVCLRGYASGWVSASPEGVIVNATAAAGFAGVEADQWLGAEYTARAPKNSASAITVTATLATQDEPGGVSAIGVSCPPHRLRGVPAQRRLPAGQPAAVERACELSRLALGGDPGLRRRESRLGWRAGLHPDPAPSTTQAQRSASSTR